MAAHASRSRWGREVGADVPLWHVGRWIQSTADAAVVTGRVRAVAVSCTLGIGRRLRMASVNEVFVRLRGATLSCCRSHFCCYHDHDEICTNHR